MSTEDSELKRIRGHALRLLSRRDYSSFQLREKLCKRYPEAQVRSIVEELVDRRLLDDAGLAEGRALMLRRRRCWGTRRIRNDLRRLGFDAKMVARATDRAESALSSGEALQQVMETWTRRHGQPDSVASLKKLFDHCRRRGFSSQRVREGLEPFWSRLSG